MVLAMMFNCTYSSGVVSSEQNGTEQQVHVSLNIYSLSQ